MRWMVLGALAVCGAILMIVPDRRATDERPFIDRASARRAGMMLLAISGTIVLGLAVLGGLAHWVASDL